MAANPVLYSSVSYLYTDCKWRMCVISGFHCGEVVVLAVLGL